MQRKPAENHRTGSQTSFPPDLESRGAYPPLDTSSQLQIEQMAHELVEASVADPWGVVSPSIYDTALAILLLPPALRPEGSIPFLLQKQYRDGCWGWENTPISYKIIPTLAATACFLHLALLAAHGEQSEVEAHDVARVAWCGLSALDMMLNDRSLLLPDTIAIELLLPALVEQITSMGKALADVHRDTTVEKTSPFWQYVQACLQIQLPQQDATLLEQVRMAAQLGIQLPVQINHCLEVLGSDLNFALFTHESGGLFNGSPAATTAIIARSQLPTTHCTSALLNVAARFYGALPVVYPITISERAWAVFYLLKAGIPLPVEQKQAIMKYLQSCVGPQGVAFAEGLFPDGDDTGVVLTLLSELREHDMLSCISSYEAADCFRCYAAERTPSVGVNAHMLEAIGSHINHMPALRERFGAAATKSSSFILARQRADGSWLDKWHASPYYATGCCVQALQHYGVGDTAVAINRALAWIVRTQRENGSWGIWCGTLEETSHALMTIILTSTTNDPTTRHAIQRGQDFLLRHLHAPADSAVRTPLWHGKELYEAERVTRAIILGALYLCCLQDAITPSSPPARKKI